MDRPVTTLFLIESVDGKISTGDSDALDVDKDFKRISGLKEGLSQYYELEKLIDPFSLNTGRVMAKIGVNNRQKNPVKINCSFIIIDNKPHLTAKGIEYLAKWVKRLFLVTANPKHPAFSLCKKYANLEIVFFDHKVDLAELLFRLKSKYGVKKLTIQSGGTLNASWVRESLVDFVSVVLAPCLVGGSNTQSLVGGESLHSEADLKKIKSLSLIKNTSLKNSYIHLLYKFNHKTKVDKAKE